MPGKTFVTGSSIHDIDESPLNGMQHGNAIVYLNGASGTVSGNTVSDFQKNGITPGIPVPRCPSSTTS